MTQAEAKEILGIVSLLDIEDADKLKKVYRKLAKERHPDVQATATKKKCTYTFEVTTEAYKLLDANWEIFYATEKREQEERRREADLFGGFGDQESIDTSSFKDWATAYPWTQSELKDYVTEEQWDDLNKQWGDYSKTMTQEEIDRSCMEAIKHKREEREYQETLRRMNARSYTPDQLKNWGEKQAGWTPFGHNFTNDKLLMTINVTVERQEQEIYRANLSNMAVPVLTRSSINVTGLLAIGDTVTIDVEDIIKVKLTLSLSELSAETKITLGPVTKALNFYLKMNKKLTGIEVTL